MGYRLCSLIALLAFFVVPTPAYYCSLNGGTDLWYCSFGCCSGFYGCCLGAGSAYWYAWLLISFFLLICLCGCGGCGAYGYRRRYVVRSVEYAPPTTTTVITPAPAPSATYKPYSEHRPIAGQYQPYEPPKEPPPPYNPASAPPPPYGAT